MMGWGSFSSAVGSGGPPGLPWARVWMGLGPRPGQIWGNGGCLWGSAGELAPEGGVFLPPLMFSSPV